ncbi:MAG: DUF4350 domain-containing protein, partial [Clostridiales bacterium]|nr:DUF4350 domain-containing protein [Clostridiales bacterium]
MRKSVIFSIIVVILAIIIAFIFDSGSDAQYTSSSERERGVSLLYDTLRYMDYPVRANRRPLTHETDLNDVYIIIQPQSPRITPEIAQEMLGWVENGGRLIFLTTYYPYTEIDYEIKSEGTEIERHFTFYSHGSGEVVTGNARNITNIRLYENSRDGQTIES